ncbi:MAG: prephenate dehydrogenase [Candidatus Omnitrophica bacterium]|nr:prephenate dehydrogenase [Candidatus Omnitrophota bacterium]MBU1997283.1 prephenate dehydrogenase [Candidatus Omnitrophota bacterium]MBU4333160.1 prephenate dehydrogenase [Candidatus Omnitrophota bacterium]
MIIKNTPFKRVTIIGVGLMGGSLGLALKKRGLAREIVGLAYRQSSLVQAIKNKAIDVAFTDPKKAVRNSDIVILAAPVDSIIKILPTIAPHIKRGCIVTDVGSTKSEIVETGEKVLPVPGFFVGAHPLVGSEKKGADYSSADLFEGGTCIMTPTEKTNQIAKEKVKYLWTKVGSKVCIVTPEKHDEILAYVSHLPHLLAYGLIDVIPQEFLEYGSTGLKDTTRIASSSPQIWNDICMANAKNVIKSLDETIKRLGEIRNSILTDDEKSLLNLFTKAKEKRDNLI